MKGKKSDEVVRLYCAVCDAFHGEFAKKILPKSYICIHCGTGQTVSTYQTIGYSHKRNYPEGFWA